jgi:hypothetical protein
MDLPPLELFSLEEKAAHVAGWPFRFGTSRRVENEFPVLDSERKEEAGLFLTESWQWELLAQRFRTMSEEKLCSAISAARNCNPDSKVVGGAAKPCLAQSDIGATACRNMSGWLASCGWLTPR